MTRSPTALSTLVAQLRDTPRDLATRIETHETRERRSGTATPDGYPRGTLGGMSTGSDDTSVERDAIARVEAPTRDEHHALTRAARRHLHTAVAELHRCLDAVNKLDRLATPDRVTEDAWCWHHARTWPDPDPEHPDLRGHVPASKNADDAGLCSACARVRRERQILPTVELMERWAAGKRPGETQEAVLLGLVSGAQAFALKAWAFGSKAGNA
jgi:hypothetical protein